MVARCAFNSAVSMCKPMAVVSRTMLLANAHYNTVFDRASIRRDPYNSPVA